MIGGDETLLITHFQEEQGVVVGGGGPGIVPGVAFPVDDEVIQQLKQLKAGAVTYVQLVRLLPTNLIVNLTTFPR